MSKRNTRWTPVPVFGYWSPSKKRTHFASLAADGPPCPLGKEVVIVGHFVPDKKATAEYHASRRTAAKPKKRKNAK